MRRWWSLPSLTHSAPIPSHPHPVCATQATGEANAAKARAKVSDRVALLKRALAGESAAAAAAAAGGGCDTPTTAATAEDADAVSALFELSTSMC